MSEFEIFGIVETICAVYSAYKISHLVTVTIEIIYICEKCINLMKIDMTLLVG